MSVNQLDWSGWGGRGGGVGLGAVGVMLASREELTWAVVPPLSWPGGWGAGGPLQEVLLSQCCSYSLGGPWFLL